MARYGYLAYLAAGFDNKLPFPPVSLWALVVELHPLNWARGQAVRRISKRLVFFFEHALYVRKWHVAVCQEVTWRSMSGSDARAQNCRTDIDDDYRTRRPSTSRAEVNASRLRENWLWKRDKTQFETYRLCLSCPSEMHTTLCGNKMPTRCNRWIFIADLIACSTCFGHHYAHHQLHTISTTWKPKHQIRQAATTCIILSSSWWWA